MKGQIVLSGRVDVRTAEILRRGLEKRGLKCPTRASLVSQAADLLISLFITQGDNPLSSVEEAVGSFAQAYGAKVVKTRAVNNAMVEQLSQLLTMIQDPE